MKLKSSETQALVQSLRAQRRDRAAFGKTVEYEALMQLPDHHVERRLRDREPDAVLAVERCFADGDHTHVEDKGGGTDMQWLQGAVLGLTKLGLEPLVQFGLSGDGEVMLATVQVTPRPTVYAG